MARPLVLPQLSFFHLCRVVRTESPEAECQQDQRDGDRLQEEEDAFTATTDQRGLDILADIHMSQPLENVHTNREAFQMFSERLWERGCDQHDF